MAISLQKLSIFVFIFLFYSSAYCQSAAKEFKRLPLEAFASLPDVSQVRLSPDGKKVVFVQRIDAADKKGNAVSVLDLTTLKQKMLTFADNKKFRIKSVFWGNNKKLLLSAIFPAVRYGTPVTETRLLVLDASTGKMRSAIPNAVLKRNGFVPQFQDGVLSLLPDEPNHFLLEFDKNEVDQPAIYKASLVKQKLKMIEGPQTGVVDWVVDRQKEVRIAIKRKGTEWQIKHRFKDGGKWKILWEYESFSPEEVVPLGFDHDPNILYVVALHQGLDAIFKVDMRDETLKKELVHSNTNYDVSGHLLYSNKKKKVIGLDVGTKYVFWDDEYEKLLRGINSALKDTHNSLAGLSHDERRYLIFAESDVDSGTYYVGDRDKKSLDPVALRYERLDPKHMAEKNRVRYKARDGLEIEGYLTLPVNHKPGDAHPTIIHPHGGPISLDGGDFDYWTQFFANRGYAVLQMNFRGSYGYGYQFMKAGLGKWGLAMQDDIADAANWMISEGYARKDKICIVGASYGGYAALMGSVKTPDLYRCAVSFAGVSDIAYTVRSSRRFTNYDIVKKQIGSNSKELRERSPLHHADKISIPVLLIHGTKDRVVKVQHSRKMYKALNKRDKEVEYLELEDGNHYLSKNEHRLKTFRAMEKFLAKYLD